MTEDELLDEIIRLKQQLVMGVKTTVLGELLDKDYRIPPYRLSVGNGSIASEWKTDALITDVASAKIERELSHCRIKAWEDYLKRMATTKFP